MKKRIITAAFLMLSAIGFSQNLSSIDVSQKQDGLFVLSNKTAKVTGSVLNGKKEGVWIESTPGTEMPKTIVSFKNGMKNGIEIEFDRNGTIQKKSEYMNDTVNGSTITYRNGRMSGMSSYCMGVLDGLKVTCYDNGNHKEEAEYKLGKRNGVTTWFSENGNRVASYTYENGLFEGVQETFYSDGTTKSIKMFHNNVLNGEVQEFYESGALKSTTTYKNGKAGKTKTYPDDKKGTEEAKPMMKK